jgi:hypothetical protein
VGEHVSFWVEFYILGEAVDVLEWGKFGYPVGIVEEFESCVMIFSFEEEFFKFFSDSFVWELVEAVEDCLAEFDSFWCCGEVEACGELEEAQGSEGVFGELVGDMF